MTDATGTHDSLKQENAILKMKVGKLTRELSKQLADNVNYIHALREKEKNIREATYSNSMLLIAGKMLQERYRVIAENIDEIVTINDLRGTYIYVNQRAADFYGLKIREMIGKSIFDIMGQEAGEKYKEDIFRPVTVENRDATTFSIFSRGGMTVHIQSKSHPIHDELGEVIGVLNIMHDLTKDRKKSEYHAIEQSINLITSFSGGLEHTIQDIFLKLCQADCIFGGGLYLFKEEKNLLELICHYNLADSFVTKVRAYHRDSHQFQIVARGVPQYDIFTDLPDVMQAEITITGRKTVAVIPLNHEEKIVGCLNFILNDPEHVTGEDRLFLETVAWRIARIISLHDSQSKLSKTVAELNETISDLKIKQQILIQKSKMESLGELSAGMAHEINQPLVIISLSIENIMQKMSVGPKVLPTAYLQRKFESMLLNVSRIQQIIDNMRIFAHDQSSIIFEKVSISELLSKTMEMVAVQFRAEGIKIIVDSVDGKAHVIGNIFKLEQVLLNLLSNSRYAVNEKFSKSANGAFQKQIEIRAARKGNHLHLEVTDNGIGIMEEHIEKLFTPFFTTKMEGTGTGLGLPIVYGIVKEMNGDIRVTSKIDEYTTVRITLPAV
jgi:PAS domain S-box-containing protein